MNSELDSWAVQESSSAVVVADTTTFLRESLPDTMFGFNTRWSEFENDLWDDINDEVYPQIVSDLLHFAGAGYRYPGGLVANDYIWTDVDILFGLNEFYTFISQVSGRPWYVLNLRNCLDTSAQDPECTSAAVAVINKAIATYIKTNFATGYPNYYLLGNELDRNGYEWEHDKYISRSRDSMDAILTADAEAKFIAFLREFDWAYTDPERGVSQYENFITEVLNAMPEVDDFSMQTYYDLQLVDGGTYGTIPTKLANFKKAIAVTRNIRPMSAWITEHSKRIKDNQDINEARDTSNILGAISAADFLIGIIQIPEIQGANWQGLQGVNRQLFDASMNFNDLRPRPVYYALRVLRKIILPIVLKTARWSQNVSAYEGGYDVNVVCFTNVAQDTFGLWVINRSNVEVPLSSRFIPFANLFVDIVHNYIAGDGAVYVEAEDIPLTTELNALPSLGTFNTNGQLTLTIAPLSVNSFIITETM